MKTNPKRAFGRAGFGLALMVLTFAFVREAVLPLTSLPVATGDQGQMIWNLWHVADSAQTGRNPYLTRNVFFPIGANLSTHTLAAGFVPVTLAVRAAARVAGIPDAYHPFVAYKVIVFLSFFLLLSLTHLVLRRIGHTTEEALIPGVAYAFCAFYRLHSVHLNHMAGFFIPLAALMLVYAVRTRTRAACLATGFVLGAAVYFTEFAVFVWLGIAFFVAFMGLSVEGREGVRRVAAEFGATGCGAAALIFVVTTAVFVGHWSRATALRPPAHETAHYSANLAAFFVPTPAATPVFGQAFAGIDATLVGMRGYEVFIGYTFLALALVGRRRATPVVRAAFLLGVVFFVLGLGPRLKLLAWDSSVPMPYALLARLPGFEQNRTPVRFVSVAMFAWTIPAAMGVRVSLAAARSAVPALPPFAAASVLLLAVGAEAYGKNSLVLERYRLPLHELAAVEDGPVLNLPLDDPGRHMAWQTVHRQPIATAYLARLSDAQAAQLEFLRAVEREAPTDLLVWMARHRFRTVISDGPLPWAFLRRFAEHGFQVVYLRGSRPTDVAAGFGSLNGVGRVPADWAEADRIGEEGRRFELAGIDRVNQVDLLADSDETFVVELVGKEGSLGELVLGPTLGPGLRWRSAAATPRMHQGRISRVVVRPRGGDGVSALRALVLLR